MFAKCLAMNNAGNPYGLNTNDAIVDPHLMKNDEWGAIAYLSKSAYGKQTEEVYINNNSNYITGIAGDTATASASTATTNAYKTAKGVKASTNGNATGVYDMSGGAWERTAAYVNNGHANLANNGGNLVIAGTTEKYRNVYVSTTTTGEDTRSADYALANPTVVSGRYGDAVYETTSSYIDSNSWYADYSRFARADSPFFARGGTYDYTSNAGVFCFQYSYGDASNSSFRVSLVVL